MNGAEHLGDEAHEAGQRALPSAVFDVIDHVGLAVRDLDAAIAWYERTFGMRLVHREVNEEQGVCEAMLRVGEEGGALLQLLAPLRDDSPVARFLAKRGEGVQQIAYRVDDVERAAETLRGRGLEVLYDRPRGGTAGSRINYVHPKSAGGVLIEIVQPAGDP